MILTYIVQMPYIYEEVASMKRGTSPQRLFCRLQKEGRSIVFRSDILRAASRRGPLPSGKCPDRDMARLATEGFVTKLNRGAWLLPSGFKPSFDIPRAWSNRSLDDPDVLIALVLDNPTLGDVVRTIFSYGEARVLGVLDAMEANDEIHPHVASIARRMVANAMEGIRNAADRHAST